MTRSLVLAGAAAGVLVVAAGTHLLRSPEARPSIVDRAGLLTGDQRAVVARYHRRLLEDHDIDYRVLTAATGDVNTFSHSAFTELGVGRASTRGRGLLLVIDPLADQVRLAVSAALEGVFTDAFVAYLEHRQMVPFFEGGRVAEGILATTELIFARAQEAEAGRAFDPTTVESFSLGGGATVPARLGAGPREATAGRHANVAAQSTPEATVETYVAAMATRNPRPDLAVYSEASREMLAAWTMTAAQMDRVVRTYRGCGDGEVRYGDRGDLAVIRYAAAKRHCSPWFLRREGGRWTLDFIAAQQIVRFNHRNQWRMPDPDGHAYAFAFSDWRFDRHGFPIELR